MLTSSPSLSALGAPTLQAESAVVSRIDGYQINEIRAWLSPNVLPSVVLADIQKVLEQSENKPPPGCRIEYAGESSKRTEAVGQLVGNVLLLIAAAIFVLVFSLRSFRATESSLPSADSLSAGRCGVFGQYNTHSDLPPSWRHGNGWDRHQRFHRGSGRTSLR